MMCLQGFNVLPPLKNVFLRAESTGQPGVMKEDERSLRTLETDPTFLEAKGYRNYMANGAALVERLT
jgi:hypothetical protein